MNTAKNLVDRGKMSEILAVGGWVVGGGVLPTFLPDLSTLCVTGIYGMYFHLPVQVHNTVHLSRHEHA